MPEKQNIEWKLRWKDEYLEWICGFANAQGGRIYIGCDDNGNITGLENTHKLLEDIPNKIRNAMNIVVDVNLLESNGKEYIEIVVPPYPVAISCKGVYYYRSGSTMQTLSGPELESFILRKRGASWDNMPLPGFTIDDIDDELVKKFKDLAVRKGRIDKIIEVLHLKYMKAIISYEGIQRIERYFVPDDALREALLNALCHKQYESGIPIQISVYEDKLYIANCGKLPENWTVENLMSKHASKPYNPSIANVFYLAGLIESWGRGIEKICQACEEDGSPAPVYTAHPGDIMIQFTASENRVLRTFVEKVTERVTDKVTDRVTDKVTDRVTDGEIAILSLLAEDPAYTYTLLAQKLDVSRKTISQRIKSLKEKGIIQRIGSEKKVYWKINSE